MGEHEGIEQKRCPLVRWLGSLAKRGIFLAVFISLRAWDVDRSPVKILRKTTSEYQMVMIAKWSETLSLLSCPISGDSWEFTDVHDLSNYTGQNISLYGCSNVEGDAQMADTYQGKHQWLFPESNSSKILRQISKMSMEEVR